MTEAFQEPWMSQANCAGVPAKPFFSESGSRDDDATWQRAQRATINRWCKPCPVRRDCLRWALSREQAGSINLGWAMFASHWRRTCPPDAKCKPRCDKHWVRDEQPTLTWKLATASSTPATGIYGGTLPTERHAKYAKHVETLEHTVYGRRRETCVNGKNCPGCRDLDEWTDLVLEGAA